LASKRRARNYTTGEKKEKAGKKDRKKKVMKNRKGP